MVPIEDINAMLRKVDQLKGKRSLLIDQRNDAAKKKETYAKTLDVALQARVIVQTVAESTQKKIEWHISNLVTSALAAVFPNPYTFELKFVQRRNKTEADLLFDKEGNETDDLINTAGGGAVDIASFALRVALYSIGHSRPVIIMDEPARFLSMDLQEKASDMIKEVSKKLGIQVIMISHLPGMIKAADRVINVTNTNGESQIAIL